MEQPGLDRNSFIIILGCLSIALLAFISSQLIHKNATLPSYSIYKFAALYPGLKEVSKSQSQIGENLKQNQPRHIFSIPALYELRLTAPNIKPISNKIQTKSIASPTPTQAPINTPSINKPQEAPAYSALRPLITSQSPETAVVNIVCIIPESGNIKQISSSGVMINDSGLILTNAHVAIHPFLSAHREINTTCKIRSGSPALATHKLSFIYISPSWTAKHQGEINGALSIDTGEGDFAILKTADASDALKLISPIQIRNSSTINPLTSFKTSETSNFAKYGNDLHKGQNIIAIAYPIMQNSGSASPLRQKEKLSINDMFGFYTYESGEEDLIETTPSVIARSGSSGGAVVDEEGYLVGIISNVIPAIDPNKSSIRAISLDHIDATLQKQAGISLENLLKSDGSALKKIFEDKYLQSVKNDLQ